MCIVSWNCFSNNSWSRFSNNSVGVSAQIIVGVGFPIIVGVYVGMRLPYLPLLSCHHRIHEKEVEVFIPVCCMKRLSFVF